MKNNIITTAVFIVTALTSSVEASGTSVPLPDFQSKEQLAAIQKARASQPAKAAAAVSDGGQFYTGKPYEADSGGYLFKFRTYNPEISRWTSADPGGFPDGANNKIYAPTPTSDLDPLGLKSATGKSTATGDQIKLNTGDAWSALYLPNEAHPKAYDWSNLSSGGAANFQYQLDQIMKGYKITPIANGTFTIAGGWSTPTFDYAPGSDNLGGGSNSVDFYVDVRDDGLSAGTFTHSLGHYNVGVTTTFKATLQSTTPYDPAIDDGASATYSVEVTIAYTESASVTGSFGGITHTWSKSSNAGKITKTFNITLNE